MRLTEAEKKRRQRERAKRGSRVISVEIMDWEAWCEILIDDSWLMGSVTNERLVGDATRNFLWKLCKDHQQQKAEQQLAEIRIPIIGLIDRETGPYQQWGLIKAKDVRPTVNPMPLEEMYDDDVRPGTPDEL
jgi:hypothetical protein